MWAQVINVFIGLALIFMPSLLSFTTTEANVNHIIAPLVVTFALTAVSEFVRNVRWLNIVCGLGLIVCVFVFSFHTTPMIIDILAAIIIIALSMVKGTIKKSYGGGWRSLFQTNPVHWQQRKRT